VSFLFRDNRRHATDGQTDGVQYLILPLGGPHIIRRYRTITNSGCRLLVGVVCSGTLPKTEAVRSMSTTDDRLFYWRLPACGSMCNPVWYRRTVYLHATADADQRLSNRPIPDNLYNLTVFVLRVCKLTFRRASASTSVVRCVFIKIVSVFFPRMRIARNNLWDGRRFVIEHTVFWQLLWFVLWYFPNISVV